MSITACLVARRESALRAWEERAARDRSRWVTSTQTARLRRRLRLWDFLLDTWTLRGRR